MEDGKQIVQLFQVIKRVYMELKISQQENFSSKEIQDFQH